MIVELLHHLPITVPMGLSVLFLTVTAAMSCAILCLEAAAWMRGRSTTSAAAPGATAGAAPGAATGAAPGAATGAAPGLILSALMESSFTFAAAAGTAVLFLPEVGGLPRIPVTPLAVSRGLVLFLWTAAFLGILRAVRTRPWPRRCVLLAITVSCALLLVWAVREALDAFLFLDSATAVQPRLPEPLLLAGLAALCIFLIGASLQLLSDALRERRRRGPGGSMVRP